MLIGHQHRFIFIHVYKTAGTSLKTTLTVHADYNWKSRNPLKLFSYFVGKFPMIFSDDLPPHSSASDIKERMGKSYNDYFSFAFVRNPFDWQVSLYNYMLKEKDHKQHEMMKELGSFEKYLLWRCEYEVRFQKDFVCNNKGEQIVSYIGRFEQLQDDYNYICNHIGLKSQKLPHLNKSSNSDYRKYYNAETRRLVEKTFMKDIEFFGYEF